MLAKHASAVGFVLYAIIIANIVTIQKDTGILLDSSIFLIPNIDRFAQQTKFKK
jgi:hypothetical protein